MKNLWKKTSEDKENNNIIERQTKILQSIEDSLRSDDKNNFEHSFKERSII